MTSIVEFDRSHFVPRRPGQVAAPRVVAAYDVLVSRFPDDTKGSVAARLGLGSDTISHARRRGSLGLDLIGRVSSALGVPVEHISDDSLEDRAVVALLVERATDADSEPTVTSSSRIETPPRYPHLETVLGYCLAKQPNRWSKATIAAARARQLKADGDPSVEEWERYLDGMESVLRRFEETGSFGAPVDAEALTPPSAKRGKRK